MKKNPEYHLYEFDRGYSIDGIVIIGIDEAGRGPLAGPVVAAAVALDLNSPIHGLDDSKKLSPKKRKALYDEITNRALDWSVGFINEDEILKLNILGATLKAMSSAVEKLKIGNQVYFVDGNRRIDGLAPQRNIIRGDSQSASIAAASIIAKVSRDAYMSELALSFPQYGFERHFGYATKEHVAALNKYGPTQYHRISFEPVRNVIEKHRNGLLNFEQRY